MISDVRGSGSRMDVSSPVARTALSGWSRANPGQSFSDSLRGELETPSMNREVASGESPSLHAMRETPGDDEVPAANCDIASTNPPVVWAPLVHQNGNPEIGASVGRVDCSNPIHGILVSQAVTTGQVVSADAGLLESAETAGDILSGGAGESAPAEQSSQGTGLQSPGYSARSVAAQSGHQRNRLSDVALQGTTPESMAQSGELLQKAGALRGASGLQPLSRSRIPVPEVSSGIDPMLAMGLMAGKSGVFSNSPSGVSRIEAWVRETLAQGVASSASLESSGFHWASGLDSGVALRWRPMSESGVSWLLEVRVDPSIRVASPEEWNRLGETLATLGVRLQVGAGEAPRERSTGEEAENWHSSRYPSNPDGKSELPHRNNSHGGNGMPWWGEEPEPESMAGSQSNAIRRFRVG